MKDKKNIDRLFQEKFKNFDVAPDALVWEKIKARQEKSRKRAVILPIWYKIAGLAASIALLLGVGYISFDGYLTTPETIVVTPNETKNVIKTTPETPFETTISSEETRMVIEEGKSNNSRKEKEKSKNQVHQSNNINPTTAKETTVAGTWLKKRLTSNDNKGITRDSHTSSQERIVENSKKDDLSNTTANPRDEHSVALIVSKDKVSSVATQNDTSQPKNQNSFITPEYQKDSPNSDNIVESNTNKSSTAKKEENKIDEHIEVVDNDRKKSLFDVIEEKEETIAEETSSTKKWNVSPNVAPVYYNVIGDGSSIDSEFADNDKTGQVNLSYGVQVSYAINKRLSIRSGVSKVDLSYNTEDIGFTASSSGQNLTGIDYSPNAEALLVSDIENQNNFSTSDINRAPINQTQNEGLLNQRIGYIEVPMEMKYALVDKKLGVNMIGGISTLFLQDNEVSIEAGGFESAVGEANNLNEVSFSGNIGLGMDYKVSEQFQINLEPIFKYQFNALNTTESFRPYYFGIYTGVSIKF